MATRAALRRLYTTFAHPGVPAATPELPGGSKLFDMYKFRPISFQDIESTLLSKSFTRKEGEENRVVFKGRSLLGVLSRDASITKEGLLVTTTIRDTDSARSFYLVIANMLLPSSTAQDARMWYPKDVKLSIKHPYTLRTSKGKVFIEVENPMFIDYAGIEVPSSCTTQDVFEEGNRALESKDFIRAVNLYSKCLEEANFPDRVEAFCRRGEAWHYAGYDEIALDDLKNALHIQGMHKRSILTKGEILFSMGSYRSAMGCFQVAQADKSLQQKCAAMIEQKDRSSFDFTDFYLGNGAVAPKLSDHIGPLAFDMADDNKGRGVFATEDVKAGRVLAVWNAAVVGDRSELRVKLMHAFMKSRKTLWQCMSLWSPEVPEYTLFNPGSAFEHDPKSVVWFEVFPTIDKLCSTYAFHSSHERQDEMAVWTLPSLFNHSCVPNVSQQIMGTVVVLRAARDIRAGEELNISYMDVKLPVHSRRSLTRKRWDFVCKCPRCKLESQLFKERPALVVLAQKMEAAVEGLKGRSAHESLYQLCRISCEVEREISGLRSEEHKNWMRTSFYDAYVSYLQNAEVFLNSMDRAPLSPVKLMEALHSTSPGCGIITDLLYLASIDPSSQDEEHDRMKGLIVQECNSIFGNEVRPDARTRFIRQMLESQGLEFDFQ